MKTSEQSQRQLRVSESIRRLIGQMLVKEDLFISGLKPTALQITQANISPDLSYASVFVNGIGGIDVNEQLKLLNTHKGLFRYRIGKEIRLRIVPDLIFKKDTSLEVADHIEELLQTPHVKQDLS